MEEILYYNENLQSVHVKTTENLYMVYPDGSVSQWNDSMGVFVDVSGWVDIPLKQMRYAAFPKWFPEP